MCVQQLATQIIATCTASVSASIIETGAMKAPAEEVVAEESSKAASIRSCALRRTALVLLVGVVSAMVPQHAYHGWASASATSTDSSNEDKPEFQRKLILAQWKIIYLHVDYRTVRYSPSFPSTFLPSAH